MARADVFLLLCSLGWALAVLGCSPEAEKPTAAPAVAEPAPAVEPRGPVEATDLFGEPLHRPQLSPDAAAKQERLLADAVADRAADPESPDAWIWVGRRQAYLGRYGDAIATYSEALERLGATPELYRHRGHRYLTTRRLEQALADFETAADLIAGRPDVVEADGLPNPQGIPTSTLGTNVWYHLGLARYLKADVEGALDAYQECLELSKNPDMRVATSYWLYLTLRRLGRDAEAAEVLEPVAGELDLLENHAYHRLLRVYAGTSNVDAETLLAEARGSGEAAFATTGYGVGAWRWLDGDHDGAQSIWRQILDTDAWSSFGYLAAEAELASPAQP